MAPSGRGHSPKRHTVKRVLAAAATVAVTTGGVAAAWSVVDDGPLVATAARADAHTDAGTRGDRPRRCALLGEAEATEILGGRLSQAPRVSLSATAGSIACLFRSAEGGTLDEIKMTFVADVGSKRRFRTLATKAPPDATVEPVRGTGRPTFWEAPLDGRPYGVLSTYFEGRAVVVQVGVARLEPRRVRQAAVNLADLLVRRISTRLFAKSDLDAL